MSIRSFFGGGESKSAPKVEIKPAVKLGEDDMQIVDSDSENDKNQKGTKER